MKNVKIKQKKCSHMNEKDIIVSFQREVDLFQNMIQNTILIAQKFKTLSILGAKELNICIQGLETTFQELIDIENKLLKKSFQKDAIRRSLIHIKKELSEIFRSFGTCHIADLISVCFDSNYLIQIDKSDKFNLIKKYVHPINYKLMDWKHKSETNHKTLAKNRIVEDFMIVEVAKSFDCFDLARTQQNFQTKVYGIKIAIQNEIDNKTLIISGVVDDLLLECTTHPFIKNKIKSLHKSKPKEKDFTQKSFDKFIRALTIKELLIYSNSELYERYIGYINQTLLIKQKSISQVIKEFINSDLYSQRTTLIQLLIHNDDPEFQYLSYLLYDLLSNDTNGSIDTIEQTILFDSLPWQIKKYFREAMKSTIKYTKNLSDFNNRQFPLEQQICLLKADDYIKEKAMIKLKEVKARSEDSGTKARQYLEGLLKIPFGIYRREPLLLFMAELRSSFFNFIELFKKDNLNIKYSSANKNFPGAEIIKIINTIEKQNLDKKNEQNIKKLIKIYMRGKRSTLVMNVCYINTLIKKYKVKKSHICHSGKKNECMRSSMKEFIIKNQSCQNLVYDLQNRFEKEFNIKREQNIIEKLSKIKNIWGAINKNIHTIEDVLENAVYGHKNAKRQIERIIGQWINGEQTGYCFGFEGPPGIGKTSLAKKGLTNCLKGENNSPRPFAFMAVGGSSNGSTLHGHNYTYVGSTWGRIVDILMEKKCMNPIIFIDELDKISRTEHGKEIVSILTHLTDPAQNEKFHDKYFSGIDLDLSKVLFIFSYNDAKSIDPILLDRIHRIKFKELSLDEKIVIVNNYILPELFTKMGLEKIIEFPPETVKYIIEKYTYEAGVRKLKEKMFEIISEINLEMLKQENIPETLPITVSISDIKFKYLKEHHEIREKNIHISPQVGIINGLWASALGLGGINPIECYWFPSSKFLELKLTGLQGDVMKESMNVSKTLAWRLTSKSIQKKLWSNFKNNEMNGGIHIHCPEGSVPKEGPSAGAAITLALFSILNKKKIKNNIAITGEINLRGEITAIGGLDIKILGGIRAGIKTFIYPKENDKTFTDFIEKYKDKNYLSNIIFKPVENIKEAMKLVFV